MRNLLRGNERRQLKTIEVLFAHDDWMTISDLAKAVDSSPRILKYDFDSMRETYKDFTIETSPKGVRLVFQKNKGLKSHYKNVFENSLAFRLLELIFFNEDYTVYEIADQLYLSISSLYRLINYINEVTIEYGFQVDTNPCRIVGTERSIRTFFYRYFFEKYTTMDWPLLEKRTEVNINNIDHFLSYLLDLSKLKLDFAYYNQLKTMVFINLIRYNRGYMVKVDYSKINFQDLNTDLKVYLNAMDYFEKSFRMKANLELLAQIFMPFAHERYSINYETLHIKASRKNIIKEEVAYIEELLKEISVKNEIPIHNMETIVYHTHNAAFYEEFDPKAGYILYNRNAHFMKLIKEEFPLFYEDLYAAVKKYRKVAGLEYTPDGMNYFMYVIFSHWDYLLVELRKKYEKVKILIMSNRDVSHAKMLKDFIEYEYGQRLIIDIYDDVFLTRDILENSDYDFIISNFPVNGLQSKVAIYVENIPTVSDYNKIGKQINHILLRRLEETENQSE